MATPAPMRSATAAKPVMKMTRSSCADARPAWHQPRCIDVVGTRACALALSRYQSLRRWGGLAHPDRPAQGFAMAPDGRTIAAISGGREPARLFRSEDGAHIASLTYPNSVSLAGSASWNVEGDYLAFVTGVPAALHVWRPFSDRQMVRIIGLDHFSDSTPFAPDGKTLAVANGRSIRLLRVHRKEF